MRFDPTRFPAAAKATGFDADNLEKVLRLRELLTEIHKHPFLTLITDLPCTAAHLCAKHFASAIRKLSRNGMV